MSLIVKKILIPVFKNANSKPLFYDLKSKLISLKIFVVGRNVILVPVKYSLLIFLDLPVTFNALLTIHFQTQYYVLPSLLISKIKFSDKAFTTDTPTPCNPPETL